MREGLQAGDVSDARGFIARVSDAKVGTECEIQKVRCERWSDTCKTCRFAAKGGLGLRGLTFKGGFCKSLKSLDVSIRST